MSNKKLLIIDLVKPSNTHYANYQEMTSWSCGRHLHNYKLVMVENGNMTHIKFDSSECTDIQTVVNKYFED